MNARQDLVSQLTSDRLKPEAVRLFADHISKFEVKSGLKAKRILVNGIPPFDDIPTVEFEVPKHDLPSVLDDLLNVPHVDPNILINGIPAAPHYQVRVMGKGR